MIAVGVDAHKHQHTVVALSPVGELLGELVIAAREPGYRELQDWLAGLGDEVLVGIEGAGSFGAGLREHLLGAGVQVFEVERPRRQDRRRGKSDRIDALAAARRVLARDGLSAPKAMGARVSLQALLVAQRSCMTERTKLLNQLQALHVTAPVALRERIGHGNGHQLARRLSRMRSPRRASAEVSTVLEVLKETSLDAPSSSRARHSATNASSPKWCAL